MNIYKNIALVLFTFLVLTGCESDETPIDLRNQLSGSYGYQKTEYHNTGIITETGTMDILNDDSEQFKLVISSDESFYGSTLDAVDSVLVFYIPEQSAITASGGTLTIKGINNVKIGERECHAGYSPEQNMLKLYYTVSFEDRPQSNYNVSVLAEKL